MSRAVPVVAALRARAVCTATVVAVLLTGCTAPRPGPGTSSDDAGPELDPAVTLPLTVEGVASCTAVRQQPAAPPDGPPLDGPRLASLELPCLTAGVPVNPARLSGRPVVLNLWATWCQPCREEMPMLQATQTRHQGRVQFLGVNTKDRPDWAADFLQQIKVTYPEVVDTDGQLLAAVRSPGLPVTLVVDRDGRLVGQQVGRISQQRLDELIGQVTA